MDSSSIMVILACGKFKGKSEVTKSELSKDFFHDFLLVLIDPFLVILIKLEVRIISNSSLFMISCLFSLRAQVF